MLGLPQYADMMLSKGRACMQFCLSLDITVLVYSLLINCNMPFFREPYAIVVYLAEGSVLGWIVISGAIQYFCN
jgi:hypothetical protein